MTRRTLSRLLASALFLAAAPLIAQAMPAMPATPQRSAPVLNTATATMEFRIVEGRGVFGLTRWVQASGQIGADTVQRFEALSRANDLRGLTVALDSPGGLVLAGTGLGRAMRAAGVDTMVGRTVVRRENGRDVATLVTHGVGCASACSYALLGGVNRRIPSTARVGLHQFSRAIGEDGRFVREMAGTEDFEQAQRLTAVLAVYVQDMGVDLRFLAAAASQPFGGDVRVLTGAEIGQFRVGTSVQVQQAERQPVAWSLGTNDRNPGLYRLATRFADNGRRIDEELFLSCSRQADSYVLGYRFVVAQGRADESLRVTRIGFAADSAAVRWQPANGQPLAAVGVNGSAWTEVSIGRDLVLAAARSDSLRVEITLADGRTDTRELGEGFRDVFGRFDQACSPQRPTPMADSQPVGRITLR